MYSLDEATVKGRILCAQTQQPVSIYQVGSKYNYKLTAYTNGKFERQATYEEGKTVVRDSIGKVIGAEKPMEKKEAPKKEPKKDKAV